MPYKKLSTILPPTFSPSSGLGYGFGLSCGLSLNFTFDLLNCGPVFRISGHVSLMVGYGLICGGSKFC